jgi:very-short-patch-repair endonuclease
MPYREIPPLPTETRNRARRLRVESTDAESRLWYRLRSARLAGLKFRRQFPIPPYVTDFCCVSAKLIVELDGSQHGDIDRMRDASLALRGYRVLRFWNNDVMERIESVLTAILDAAQHPTLTPNPSPAGRGENIDRGSTP